MSMLSTELIRMIPQLPLKKLLNNQTNPRASIKAETSLHHALRLWPCVSCRTMQGVACKIRFCVIVTEKKRTKMGPWHTPTSLHRACCHTTNIATRQCSVALLLQATMQGVKTQSQTLANVKHPSSHSWRNVDQDRITYYYLWRSLKLG